MTEAVASAGLRAVSSVRDDDVADGVAEPVREGASGETAAAPPGSAAGGVVPVPYPAPDETMDESQDAPSDAGEGENSASSGSSESGQGRSSSSADAWAGRGGTARAEVVAGPVPLESVVAGGFFLPAAGREVGAPGGRRAARATARLPARSRLAEETPSSPLWRVSAQHHKRLAGAITPRTALVRKCNTQSPGGTGELGGLPPLTRRERARPPAAADAHVGATSEEAEEDVKVYVPALCGSTLRQKLGGGGGNNLKATT